jgi:hypothetical protein
MRVPLGFLHRDDQTDDEGGHLSNFSEDRAALPPADAVSHQLLKEQVRAVLDLLSGRERRVLQLRHPCRSSKLRDCFGGSFDYEGWQCALGSTSATEAELRALRDAVAEQVLSAGLILG